MKTYVVYFTTTASAAVEVEAESKEDAIDRAHQEVEFPFFPGGMDGDLGDWDADVDDVEEIR